MNSFARRRSNFYGLLMKGVVVPQYGFMDIVENYEEKLSYFQENKTFLANGFTYGIFNDIMKRLESQHNFTCMLYLQDPDNGQKQWGKVVFHKNGSTEASGMLGEVFLGKADIAVTSITIKTSRLQFLDFLPPMAPEVASIVVPTNAVTESLDFWLFASPLHLHLWIAILGTVFALATAKMVMLDGCKCFKLNQYLWSTVKAYLGEASNETCNAKSSVQILVLTSLLAGYVIWTSYNAFLTSELMVKEKEYPFVDMESLSSTDWK